MVTEHVKDDESFESAYKRFKRRCEKEQIFWEFKRHEHYEKPSQKKREAFKNRDK
ncbi:MAG: 30S ribosomal protein S21 [bacterium]|jgi:small subunit ribosomal protein S21|nr:30S ribosomal protein S21 [bacterium]MDD5529344.1 30S ribosomal protein S21 [bacterium]